MSEKKYWDAIIIGGGPAGSTVARYAAEGGLRVLVVDGRDPIGTPLQCGELVPTNEEMKRLCPNVPEVDDLFRTPDEAISSTSNKMRIWDKSSCLRIPSFRINNKNQEKAR